MCSRTRSLLHVINYNIRYIIKSMEKTMEQFGERLARIRERSGLTQKQLADAIGVTVQTISNWETGIRKPRLYLEETSSLCEALSCTLDELTGKE